MGLLEDILLRQYQPTPAGVSPFPVTAPVVDEAAMADAAREAAGKRLIRVNQRRFDPNGIVDAQGAGIQLALGNAPEGTGVPAAEVVAGPTAAPSVAETIPLPMARPASAPSVPTDVSSANRPAMPMSANAGMLPTVAPAVVQPPVAAPSAPVGMAGGPSILDRITKGLSDNSQTLLALGAGFAGAPNIGQGISRAAAAAIPAQQADQQRILSTGAQYATQQAMKAAGVPDALARAALGNPNIMKSVVENYLGDRKSEIRAVKRADGSEVLMAINPYDQSAKVVSGGAVDSGPLQATPEQQSRVQAIIEGREPYPAPTSRSPDAQFIREQVHKADPSFDAVNYASRQKTRNDFTAGKSAQNLTAFNTAIGHLGTLNDAIDGLNNSSYPAWNKVANTVSENTDPKFAANLKKFQTARTAVSDELTRAFRGSGGNVHDIKQWEAAINQADSPEALRAAVQQAAELLNSRVVSVGDQYNRGMGTTKDPMELLTPKAAASFKHMLEGNAGKPDAAKPVATVAPQMAVNPKTGERLILRDGKWQPIQ